MTCRMILGVSGLVLVLLAPSVFAQTASTRVRPVARRVVAHRNLSYLGVGFSEIDADRAKALQLKDARGVEIRCVDENSPAAKAGLQIGDVVLEYNGEHIEGAEQFTRLIKETPPGRSASLVVWRNGVTKTVSAAIGTRQSGPSVFEFDGEDFALTMPALPAMPAMPAFRMPDIPRTFMSWRSPILGIESESLNPQLAEFFGVKEGVLVRSVNRGSAAEKAGFKAGDVIIKVDGERVTTPKEISSILQESRSKGSISVTVVRHQKEMSLSVTVEQAADWPGTEGKELL
ncbi:MAG: hypothetical protein DMG57_26450 [Acidobacteria bacterium]|nr:MAG: hypothetical protein DMG57_26450 [Acidobacteriota bacterium]